MLYEKAGLGAVDQRVEEIEGSELGVPEQVKIALKALFNAIPYNYDMSAAIEIIDSWVSSNIIHSWDFTKSLVDGISGKTFELNGATRSNNGLLFDAKTENAVVSNVLAFGRVLEIKFGTLARNTTTWPDASVNGTNGLAFWTNETSNYGFAFNKASQCWAYYTNAYSTDGVTIVNGNRWALYKSLNSPNILSNKTVKFVIGASGIIDTYIDGTKIQPVNSNDEPSYPAYNSESDMSILKLGSDKATYPAFCDMVMKSIKISSLEE